MQSHLENQSVSFEDKGVELQSGFYGEKGRMLLLACERCALFSMWRGCCSVSNALSEVDNISSDKEEQRTSLKGFESEVKCEELE